MNPSLFKSITDFVTAAKLSINTGGGEEVYYKEMIDLVRLWDRQTTAPSFFSLTAGIEQPPVTYVILAEVGGEMVVQHPAALSFDEAERRCRAYGPDSRTAIVPMMLSREVESR